MKKITLFILLVLGVVLYVPSLQADTSYHRVLLVVAMDKEAAPIINALNLKKSLHSFSNLPMQGYVGKYNNLAIFLILNGKDPVNNVQNVGTQAATLATYLGIKYFHPDLVINVGTAGGTFASGAKVGDIYISQKIYFYARRIPLPGYAEYGMGGYDSANFDQITNSLNLRKGIVCSGDSFDDDQKDTDVISKNNCAVREMEAAGVAWLSMLTNTPMFAMKGITDMIESKDGHDDFKKNFAQVTENLADKLKLFLDKLA
jgi:5'-methylthioadenosine nucleosidase